MILIDHPRPCTGVDAFRRFRRTAHCMSDLPGEAGSAELLAFGDRIGQRRSWLQKSGQPDEHFDLFDGRIERAIAAGAVEVSGRDLILRVVQPKRAAVAAARLA